MNSVSILTPPKIAQDKLISRLLYLKINVKEHLIKSKSCLDKSVKLEMPH